MSPWSHPPFRRYFVGYSTSLFGTSLVPVALAFAVLDATRPNPTTKLTLADLTTVTTDLSIVLSAAIIPHLLFLLIGGTVSDRMPRKTVLVTSHLAAGTSQAGLATVFLLDHYSLPLVVALAIISGTTDGFATPALRGIVHELVPPDQLQRATSMVSLTRNIARVLGHAVAGIIATTANPGIAIACDAASFLIAAAFFAGLPALSHVAADDEPLLQSLRGGWRYIGATPWILVCTLGATVINLCTVGPRQVLGPSVVGTLHAEYVWGLTLSASAVGAIITSAWLYKVPLRRILLWTCPGTVIYGCFLASIGLSAPATVLIGVSLIAGAAATANVIGFDTALQHQVPSHLQSRVFAAEEFISFGAIPLSQLAMPPLVTAYGAPTVLIACGVFCALASVAQLASRSVRTLDISTHPAPP